MALYAHEHRALRSGGAICPVIPVALSITVRGYVRAADGLPFKLVSICGRRTSTARPAANIGTGNVPVVATGRRYKQDVAPARLHLYPDLDICQAPIDAPGRCSLCTGTTPDAPQPTFIKHRNLTVRAVPACGAKLVAEEGLRAGQARHRLGKSLAVQVARTKRSLG